MTGVFMSPAGCGGPLFVGMQYAVRLLCLNKRIFAQDGYHRGSIGTIWFSERYLYHVRLPLDYLKLGKAFLTTFQKSFAFHSNKHSCILYSNGSQILEANYSDKMPQCGVDGCKGEVASWTVTETCTKRVVDENGVGGDCGITKTGTAKACLKCSTQHGTKMGKCPRLKH